jgi:hypothetical protein
MADNDFKCGDLVKFPLRIALEKGFHSLVLVLLRGGAVIDKA